MVISKGKYAYKNGKIIKVIININNLLGNNMCQLYKILFDEFALFLNYSLFLGLVSKIF